jgi:predicted nucleic acid-binding protein
MTVFRCTTASPTAMRMAFADVVAGRASYWDVLLMATSREAGCSLLLTEGMADETDFGGVRIHNPFSPLGGLSLLARRLLVLD